MVLQCDTRCECCFGIRAIPEVQTGNRSGILNDYLVIFQVIWLKKTWDCANSQLSIFLTNKYKFSFFHHGHFEYVFSDWLQNWKTAHNVDMDTSSLTVEKRKRDEADLRTQTVFSTISSFQQKDNSTLEQVDWSVMPLKILFHLMFAYFPRRLHDKYEARKCGFYF